MNFQDKINEAIALDEKSTRSDKLFNYIALICGFLTCIALVAVFITYTIDEHAGMKVWEGIFYPTIILIALGIVCASCQILRNRYLTTIISIVMIALSLCGIIAFIIFQIVVYKAVFIIPFNYFMLG